MESVGLRPPACGLCPEMPEIGALAQRVSAKHPTPRPAAEPEMLGVPVKMGQTGIYSGDSISRSAQTEDKMKTLIALTACFFLAFGTCFAQSTCLQDQ